MDTEETKDEIVEVIKESNGDIAEEVTVRGTKEITETDSEKPPLIDRAYNGLLPISIFCGLIGMLLGPVPAALWALAAGKVFFPLFIAAPMITLLFCRLLKSGRDLRTLIVTAVFSLAGAYLTALTCQAAIYVRTYNMSVFNIPLVTMLSLGKSGVLPASASAYIFPLLFTAFGVAAAWEILRAGAHDGGESIPDGPSDAGDIGG